MTCYTINKETSCLKTVTPKYIHAQFISIYGNIFPVRLLLSFCNVSHYFVKLGVTVLLIRYSCLYLYYFRFLYVLIAVIICSLIAGMLLFFLISRSITLDSEDEIISPTILQKIKGEEMIFMEYQVSFLFCQAVK